MSSVTAIEISSISDAIESDLLVVISDRKGATLFPALAEQLDAKASIDPRVFKQPTLLAFDEVSMGRCLYVNCPALVDDFDDIRVFFDLGKSIAEQALQLNAQKPTLVFDVSNNLSLRLKGKQISISQAIQVSYLGMCQHLWQPLEARQFLGDDIEKVQQVFLVGLNAQQVNKLNALEAGKRAARDLCGTEPERMAPPGFADYCENLFANTQIQCNVIKDPATIALEYPLLYAVARASIEVERHQPRIIELVYQGDGPTIKTFYFAGKGITYDTGGADLKVNGHMAGMSRDKGGAATVAGLMLALSRIKPKGIKVVAQIGAVRNSIGAEAYVPDEIITSHAGKRVRVGNTDAEGRMLLADLLSHLREQALSDAIKVEPATSHLPQLFSVATLTGHAAISLGPYTALVENLPAKQLDIAQTLCGVGEKWADPCEQSLLRKEDFAFVASKTLADDVLSSNNAPSVSTVRGHQFPAAFLSIASGLSEHGNSSQNKLAFTHVDIAGSGVENMDWQHGKPTAAGVACLLNSIIED